MSRAAVVVIKQHCQVCSEQSTQHVLLDLSEKLDVFPVDRLPPFCAALTFGEPPPRDGQKMAGIQALSQVYR